MTSACVPQMIGAKIAVSTHERHEGHRGDAEGRAQDPRERAHQASATVVRGSSTARIQSTIVLMMSTSAP